VIYSMWHNVLYISSPSMLIASASLLARSGGM